MATNAQNPFQHTAVLDPRTTTLELAGWLGQQRGDLLHCASVSNGPDRASGPPSALPTLLTAERGSLAGFAGEISASFDLLAAAAGLGGAAS